MINEDRALPSGDDQFPPVSVPRVTGAAGTVRIRRNLPVNSGLPPTFDHSALMVFTLPDTTMILSGNEIWPSA
jgi:hypothetical protein